MTWSSQIDAWGGGIPIIKNFKSIPNPWGGDATMIADTMDAGFHLVTTPDMRCAEAEPYRVFTGDGDASAPPENVGTLGWHLVSDDPTGTDFYVFPDAATAQAVPDWWTAD